MMVDSLNTPFQENTLESNVLKPICHIKIWFHVTKWCPHGYRLGACPLLNFNGQQQMWNKPHHHVQKPERNLSNHEIFKEQSLGN